MVELIILMMVNILIPVVTDDKNSLDQLSRSLRVHTYQRTVRQHGTLRLNYHRL